jgi:GPH family glycoside/pentoside/hexuronide:cation symporter
LLEALGYKPGGRDPAALNALAIVYAFVPCVLKLGAGGALLWFRKSQ